MTNKNGSVNVQFGQQAADKLLNLKMDKLYEKQVKVEEDFHVLEEKVDAEIERATTKENQLQENISDINIELEGLQVDILGLGNVIDLELDEEYKLNAKLYHDEQLISTSSVIDLPLESMIISGSYDSQTKELVLTLQNGSTIRISIADLISGLQEEITVNNKLSADLVDDVNTVNKFVTTSDKEKWNKVSSEVGYVKTTNRVTDEQGHITGYIITQNDIVEINKPVCFIDTDVGMFYSKEGNPYSAPEISSRYFKSLNPQWGSSGNQSGQFEFQLHYSLNNLTLAYTQINSVKVDSSITSNSSNPVTSSSIYTALNNKQDKLPTVVNDRYLHTNESTGALEWSEVQAGIDSDVTVEIEWDYSNDDYQSRTNYDSPIALQQWIANCEAGNVYTNDGIIAKVNNLINGKAFRLILIGTNKERLIYDNTTAKTTWHFLDCPQNNVRLGLPFNLLDWNSVKGRSYLMDYLNGVNSNGMVLYPSNMNGLISAQGLLEASHTIFESLPDTLKRHTKTVRRYYYRKRNYMSIGANGGNEINNGEMCLLACNVFHLAGTDLGTSGQSGEGSGSQYSYFNSNARRIRFYNGNAINWWNASLYNGDDTNRWYTISQSGSGGLTSTYLTSESNAVAPAICI